MTTNRGNGPVSARDEVVLAFIAQTRPKLEQIKHHLSLTHDQARDTVFKLRRHGLIHSVRFGKTKKWCVTADLERTNDEAVEHQMAYQERRQERSKQSLEKLSEKKQEARRQSAMRGEEPLQTITQAWAPAKKRGPASVWEWADVA